MNYLLHLVILFDIYFIVAMSLNIVVGYCGLLTLSHAAFFGIGTYAYALSVQAWGWDFLSAAALGIGLAALASLILSLAAWRFRGDFFVLISLSIQFALFSVINNWHSPREAPGTLANLTNGPYGLEGIPRPTIFGFAFESIESIVILFTVVAALFALLCRKLLASPWGRMLQAMRDDELAARGLGKRVRLAKVQAIAIALRDGGLRRGAVRLLYQLHRPGHGLADRLAAAADHDHHRRRRQTPSGGRWSAPSSCWRSPRRCASPICPTRWRRS